MKQNRYEIKFVLNELEFIEVKYFLKYINSFKSYPQRNVSSLYYETYDYSTVKDNISGVSNRKKLRLRWYDDNTRPKVEIKNKFSRVGNKKTFLIDLLDKEAINTLSVRGLNQIIFNHLKKNHNETFLLNQFVPVLKVFYEREYYETNRGLRITIDKNINFSQVSPNQNIHFHKNIKFNKRVMELKFPVDLKSHVNDLIRNLNVTPKRNSKFLLGMSKLGYVNYV
jgi:hypothetical protein